MQLSSSFNNERASTLLSLPKNCQPKGYLPEIGQELNTADYPGLFSEIGISEGYEFYHTSSATPIVNNLTSNTSHAGFTASASSHQSTDDAWKLFDASSSTFLYHTGITGQWAKLVHPSAIFAKYEVVSNNGNPVYAPSTFEIQRLNGASWLRDSLQLGLTYQATGETKTIIPDTFQARTETRLYIHNAGAGCTDALYSKFLQYPYAFGSFTQNAHPFVDGDEVLVQSATGNKPAEFTQNYYFVNSLTANTYSLHPTALDATNNTNAVVCTSVGENLRIYKKGKFRLKDSRNGIYTNFIKY